jgi:hypothetical protein
MKKRTPQPSASPLPKAEPGTPSLKPDQCPKCQSPRIQPIVYGYPTAATLAAADRGDIFLGGCSAEPWLPEWNCPACGHQWLAGDDPEKREFEEMMEFIRHKFPKK